MWHLKRKRNNLINFQMLKVISFKRIIKKSLCCLSLENPILFFLPHFGLIWQKKKFGVKKLDITTNTKIEVYKYIERKDFNDPITTKSRFDLSLFEQKKRVRNNVFTLYKKESNFYGEGEREQKLKSFFFFFSSFD